MVSVAQHLLARSAMSSGTTTSATPAAASGTSPVASGFADVTVPPYLTRRLSESFASLTSPLATVLPTPSDSPRAARVNPTEDMALLAYARLLIDRSLPLLQLAKQTITKG